MEYFLLIHSLVDGVDFFDCLGYLYHALLDLESIQYFSVIQLLGVYLYLAQVFIESVLDIFNFLEAVKISRLHTV